MERNDIQCIEYFFSHQFLHRLPSGITGRLGFYNVQGYRLVTWMESRPIFQYDDFLLGLAGEERFHCRHHRNLQRDQGAISADVGRQGAHSEQLCVSGKLFL